MSTILWTAFALPVISALLCLYFTAERRSLRLTAKGGATCVALATAVFCSLRDGGLPADEIIVCAIALFALADILLDVKFSYGVAAFALGHIALIVWLLEQESALHRILFSILSFSIAAGLYALSVLRFRQTLRRVGKKAVVMLLYAAILALMTGVSLTLPYFGGIRYLPFALGAALFMISDLMVAQGILIGMTRKWHILAMILYESAVMLMALSA